MYVVRNWMYTSKTWRWQNVFNRKHFPFQLNIFIHILSIYLWMSKTYNYGNRPLQRRHCFALCCCTFDQQRHVNMSKASNPPWDTITHTYDWQATIVFNHDDDCCSPLCKSLYYARLIHCRLTNEPTWTRLSSSGLLFTATNLHVTSRSQPDLCESIHVATKTGLGPQLLPWDHATLLRLLVPTGWELLGRCRFRARVELLGGGTLVPWGTVVSHAVSDVAW